jgi:hypothetical protein
MVKKLEIIFKNTCKDLKACLKLRSVISKINRNKFSIKIFHNLKMKQLKSKSKILKKMKKIKMKNQMIEKSKINLKIQK